MTAQQINVKAFLDTIRWCEGTEGELGYRMLFGYHPRVRPKNLFSDFSKHPNKAIRLPSGKDERGKTTYITSTAAGAYQILYRTYLDVNRKIIIKDFTPETQDKIAIQLIKQRGALDEVLRGEIEKAVFLCQNEWASLPNSKYGQPTKTIQGFLKKYEENFNKLKTII